VILKTAQRFAEAVTFIIGNRRDNPKLLDQAEIENSSPFEIALVRLRLDHVAIIIVNAKRNADCVWLLAYCR
jgi:hypothetical protein